MYRYGAPWDGVRRPPFADLEIGDLVLHRHGRRRLICRVVSIGERMTLKAIGRPENYLVTSEDVQLERVVRYLPGRFL